MALIARLVLSVRALVTPPVVWNARISSSQRCRVRTSRRHSGACTVAGPGIDEREHVTGVVDVIGLEQAADELFELPGRGDVSVGIAGV
jgi:hypothetical protein